MTFTNFRNIGVCYLLLDCEEKVNVNNVKYSCSCHKVAWGYMNYDSSWSYDIFQTGSFRISSVGLF